MKGWVLLNKLLPDQPQVTYSRERFMQVAERRGIDLTTITPERFEIIVSKGGRKSILVDDEVVDLPDFVIPRMGAAATYFTLAVMRQLEHLGVFALNTAQSIENVKDKLLTQQILGHSGLPIPKTILMKNDSHLNIDLIKKQLGFPVIVKSVSGSKGTGVFLCETQNSLLDLTGLMKSTKNTANLIVQQFIKTSKGRDLRVLVVGGRAVACMERRGQKGQYKANFSQGGSVREYKINQEVELLALESSKILGLEFGGIDLLFDGDHYKICEANSSPGFEGLEKCCDISVPDVVFDFIEIRLGMR